MAYKYNPLSTWGDDYLNTRTTSALDRRSIGSIGFDWYARNGRLDLAKFLYQNRSPCECKKLKPYSYPYRSRSPYVPYSYSSAYGDDDDYMPHRQFKCDPCKKPSPCGGCKSKSPCDPCAKFKKSPCGCKPKKKSCGCGGKGKRNRY